MDLRLEGPLPKPLIQLFKSRSQGPGADYLGKTIRVTTLIEPPWMKRLEAIHWKELDVTPHQLMMSTLGTSFHTLVEQQKTKGGWQEGEVTAEALDWTITGHFDYLTDEGDLWDWKVTSAYKVINQDYRSWEEQLNIYAFLIGLTEGFTFPEVRSLNVFTVLRDWAPSKARQGNGYPSVNHAIIKLPLWSPDSQLAFILDRLKAHDADSIACTDKERWKSPDVYRVMLPGATRAARRLNSEEEAHKWARENLADDEAYAVQRMAGSARRCETYCAVSRFCSARTDIPDAPEEVARGRTPPAE